MAALQYLEIPAGGNISSLVGSMSLYDQFLGSVFTDESFPLPLPQSVTESRMADVVVSPSGIEGLWLNGYAIIPLRDLTAYQSNSWKLLRDTWVSCFAGCSCHPLNRLTYRMTANLLTLRLYPNWATMALPLTIDLYSLRLSLINYRAYNLLALN